MLSLTTSVQCTGTTVQIRRIIYPEGVIKSVTCVCASFDTLCLFFFIISYPFYTPEFRSCTRDDDCRNFAKSQKVGPGTQGD